MADPSDRLSAGLADRYRIARVEPALKGGLGLGATRRVLKDPMTECPSGHVAARRAAPSRGFSPGIPRGRA